MNPKNFFNEKSESEFQTPNIPIPNIPIEELLAKSKGIEEKLQEDYSESVISKCRNTVYKLSEKELQVKKIEEDIKALEIDINDLHQFKESLHQFIKRATIYLSPLPQVPKIIVLFFIILLSIPFIQSGYSNGFLPKFVIGIVSISLIIVFQYATGKMAKAVWYAPLLPTGDLDQTQAKNQLVLSSIICVSVGISILVYLELQKASFEGRTLGLTTLATVLFATLLFTLWIVVVMGAAKKEVFGMIDFLEEYVQEKPSKVQSEYHNKKNKLKIVRKRLKQLDEEIQFKKSSLFTLRIEIDHLTKELFQKLEEHENEHY